MHDAIRYVTESIAYRVRSCIFSRPHSQGGHRPPALSRHDDGGPCPPYGFGFVRRRGLACAAAISSCR